MDRFKKKIKISKTASTCKENQPKKWRKKKVKHLELEFRIANSGYLSYFG